MIVIRIVLTTLFSLYKGVLLNRVSRDTGIIDEMLPGRLFDSVDVAIIDISISIMIIILNVYLIFPFGILMILVLLFRQLYLKTGRLKFKRNQEMMKLILFSYILLYSENRSYAGGCRQISSYSTYQLVH